MKLKVCGMRETKNITALASLQPDYMGFIFWEPSKRYCATIPSDIPKAIKKVGVFVDETTEQIKAKVKLFGLDAVQLHGDESPRQCAALLNLCEVIKAFRIGPDFDFKQLAPYQDQETPLPPSHTWQRKNCRPRSCFESSSIIPKGNEKTRLW